MAVLFLPSGFAKLSNLGGFAHSLAARSVPVPSLFAVIGASVEFFGSLAIALGFKMRYAALLMAAFVAVATIISHRFWEADAATYLAQYSNFFKNLAIMGGFLVLYARGAGPYSIDRTK